MLIEEFDRLEVGGDDRMYLGSTQSLFPNVRARMFRSSEWSESVVFSYSNFQGHNENVTHVVNMTCHH
jgi:hypothetical protein